MWKLTQTAVCALSQHYSQFHTHWSRLVGKKGLKFSSPSACRFVGRDVRSVLEDEADARFDCPKMAVPSEPALYSDTELDDFEMGCDELWPDSAKKNVNSHI